MFRLTAVAKIHVQLTSSWGKRSLISLYKLTINDFLSYLYILNQNMSLEMTHSIVFGQYTLENELYYKTCNFCLCCGVVDTVLKCKGTRTISIA